MDKDPKFLFDLNIFDAPEKEEETVEEYVAPPPPTFSEEEMALAKDLAFEQGRQEGERSERESREQFVAVALDKIAQNFSHLFAAETLRENIFEKESLRLAIGVLDVLFPLLNNRFGSDEVRTLIQKTLTDHRKKKEILIFVAPGMKGEIDTLIGHLRENEHEEAVWRVIEEQSLSEGDCRLEWSDGGAVRDSVRCAQDIRKTIEGLLGEKHPVVSEFDTSDVELTGTNESAAPATAGPSDAGDRE